MIHLKEQTIRKAFVCCCCGPIIFIVIIALMYNGKVFDFESPDIVDISEAVKLARSKRSKRRIGDESVLPFTVKSSVLRKKANGELNDRYLPTIGNGHISTTPYSSHINMNGFYSGQGSDSHMAKIPTMIMGRLRITDKDLDDRAERNYIFNAKEGVYIETIDCEFAYIEHRMYTHQKYIRLLISSIYVKRKNTRNMGILRMEFPNFLDGEQDLEFNTELKHNYNPHMSGRTKTAEGGSKTEKVHMIWMEPRREFDMRSNREPLNSTIIMAIDRQANAAQKEFDHAVQMILDNGHYRLLKEHTDTWKRVWDTGVIEVQGNLQLSKVTWFAQYYLMSSLPSEYAKQKQPPSQVYHGVQRTSLAKGNRNKNYRGHIFWDSEMYILPAIVLFHPKLAKIMLRYRAFKSQSATENAAYAGIDGMNFPWESGTSGLDITPNTCTTCSKYGLHVSAAIAYGIRVYYSATRDKEYLTNPDYKACNIVREIARFYTSLARYNTSTARYDIRGVMGPDDYHPNIDNSAYFNAIASLAIHYARYFACLCGRPEREEVPDKWVHIALFLTLHYDNEKRLHYQFEGYEKVKNSTIKQADTIMMVYPLNWNTSLDIMRNDLEYYEDKIDQRTPAMTWSFYTVGWRMVNEESKANAYFHKSYQDYMLQPFKVWTEYNERDENDEKSSGVNFLPGIGGFIQSIVNGYAGIRIRPQQLEFHNPAPPPDCTGVRFRHLDYQRAVFDVEITRKHVNIRVLSIGEYPLVLEHGTTKRVEPLIAGRTLKIKDLKKGFMIYSTLQPPCEHPKDHIYMPWGYSPWISSAPAHSNSLFLLFVCLMSLTALFNVL